MHRLTITVNLLKSAKVFMLDTFDDNLCLHLCGHMDGEKKYLQRDRTVVAHGARCIQSCMPLHKRG